MQEKPRTAGNAGLLNTANANLAADCLADWSSLKLPTQRLSPSGYPAEFASA